MRIFRHASATAQPFLAGVAFAFAVVSADIVDHGENRPTTVHESTQLRFPGRVVPGFAPDSARESRTTWISLTEPCCPTRDETSSGVAWSTGKDAPKRTLLERIVTPNARSGAGGRNGERDNCLLKLDLDPTNGR